MAALATEPLSDQFQQIPGTTVAGFCEAFDAWKAGFPDTEHTSFLFGKDGAYATPTVDGKRYVLRHVHLVPLHDQTALQKWLALYQLGMTKGHWTRRTSNRVLIYATRSLAGGGEAHLLMYILNEPDAHEIALMKTAGDRRFMEQFATCAAAFIHDGTVDL